MRRLMNVAIVAAVVSCALAGTSVAGQNETERVSKTVPIASGGTLTLKNFSGRVTMTASDRTDVAIDAVRKAPRERLDNIKLDIQATGGNVVIEANKKTDSWFSRNNNVVETDLDIKLPRKVNLDVSVFSSPVSVTGVEGRYDLHSFSGDLTLQGATGPVKVKTFSGNVKLSLARSVDRPEIDADTFSGSIEVSLADTAKAGIDFSTFSGDINSDLPLTFSSKSKRSLKAGLNATSGGATNDVRLKTFSGDVRLKR